MQTLFISDLHLDDSRQDKVELFIQFLDSLTPDVKQLFILGDLFEFWNGDDDLNQTHQKVVTALSKLSHRNIALFVMRGNRDFLFGPRFEQQTNCKLLKDPTVIELFGNSTLIMHGDLLCTDDISYQRLRKITNNRFIQWLFLCLPLTTRRRISNRGRKISQSENQKKTTSIMDVNPVTVKQYLEEYQTTLLIHGHTHRQAQHELHLDNHKKAKRIVLGDWYQDDCVLVYEQNNHTFLRIKDYIRSN